MRIWISWWVPLDWGPCLGFTPQEFWGAMVGTTQLGSFPGVHSQGILGYLGLVGFLPWGPPLWNSRVPWLGRVLPWSSPRGNSGVPGFGRVLPFGSPWVNLGYHGSVRVPPWGSPTREFWGTTGRSRSFPGIQTPGILGYHGSVEVFKSLCTLWKFIVPPFTPTFYSSKPSV